MLTTHCPPEIARKIGEKIGGSQLGDAIRIFDMLARAAEAGERCPTQAYFLRQGISHATPLMRKMADLGLIHVEVGGKNWRTVWICAGPHRGKATSARLPAVRTYLEYGPGRP